MERGATACSKVNVRRSGVKVSRGASVKKRRLETSRESDDCEKWSRLLALWIARPQTLRVSRLLGHRGAGSEIDGAMESNRRAARCDGHASIDFVSERWLASLRLETERRLVDGRGIERPTSAIANASAQKGLSLILALG